MIIELVVALVLLVLAARTRAVLPAAVALSAAVAAFFDPLAAGFAVAIGVALLAVGQLVWRLLGDNEP